MSSKSKYTKQLTVSLNDLRKQNELCDVTIHVSKKSFPAHRAVLAAASSYFRAMFAPGFRESTDKEVNIDGDPDIFEDILNYAYTGHMKVTSTTAYLLLEMACYLQFTDICQHCPKFLHLSSSLPITDMLKMHELASSHEYLGMKTLASEIMKHMCSYVQDMTSSEKFLETADVSFLKRFLSQDDLSSEEDVLDMVISWLKCDWKTRRPHALCLLEKVRFGLVPEDRLKRLTGSDIIGIPECQQWLQNVAKELSSGDSKIVRAMNDPALFARRGTITAPITLIRPPGEKYLIFKYFDFDERNWKDITGCETPQSQHKHFQTSLTVANDTLYAIGALSTYRCGRLVESTYQLCWKYNERYNRWDDLPSMRITTGHSQSVFTDGFIYQIGDGDCAERFDVAEEKWEMLTSLPPRFRNCTSATDYQGSIVVYGVGYLPPYTHRTHVIQTFHTKKHIWQTEMCDKVEIEEGKDINPTLFKQGGHVYRILYKVNETDRFRNDPVVNILELQSTGNGITHVSVGEKVKQDWVPATSVGAFRIQEQVFVNVNGCVLLTHFKIKPNQDKELPRELLELFEVYPSFGDSGSSNIVNFTFEKKLCIIQASQEQGYDANSDEVDSDDSINDQDKEEEGHDDEKDGEDDDNSSNQ